VRGIFWFEGWGGWVYSGRMPSSVIVILLVVVACLLCGCLVLLWKLLRRPEPTGPGEALGLLSQQMAQTQQQLAHSLRDFSTNVNERLTQSQSLAQQSQRFVSERLAEAGKTTGDLKGQLGQLSQATERILQVGGDVRQLQDILQSPKLRGNLGEWSLETLLADVLPRAHYELQYHFPDNTAVDALVRLAEGSVCIDAKFPLARFRGMMEAEDEQGRVRMRKAFLRDVRSHIDAIASKYIQPEQGTLDFALMYVPAENVYYEAMLGEDGLDVGGYGRSKKVIPVSPNTLYAYLMAIAAGLRGLQIERNAQRILRQLGQLTTDLSLFTNDFAVLGKHLTNAQSKFVEAQKKMDVMALKLEHIHEHSLPGEEGEEG